MKNISGEIRSYKDEILEDIVRIVRIPSTRGTAREDRPFGEGPAKSLDYCLDLAKSLGLSVKNVGGRAGHVEYGEGEGLVGVLVHCDVVPAGEGWTRPPFGGEVENGRIYGRGVMDDKGPAIAAIYCLKALSDLKIVPKRRIRVIIGAAEESGMEDMEYYFAHEQMPDLAFSPDGLYPICNREKGIMHIRLEAVHSGPVLSFASGLAANIVPVAAEALCDTRRAAPFEVSAARQDDRFKYAVMSGERGVTLRCFGKAAHASVPEDGINAAAGLIRLISDVYGGKAGTLVSFLDSSVGLECDGAKIGVAASDEPSGALTLNLGVVSLSPELDSAVVDVRYPVTAKGGPIFEKIAARAEENGVTASLVDDSAPLFVDEGSALIKKLKHAYTTVTGKEAETYSTGGGSYARVLENRGVAFGAGMHPLAYNNIHGTDEFLAIDEFMEHCEICLQAIYELGCE